MPQFPPAGWRFWRQRRPETASQSPPNVLTKPVEADAAGQDAEADLFQKNYHVVICAAKDIDSDSEEGIEMILTSIGRDAFDLCNVDLDNVTEFGRVAGVAPELVRLPNSPPGAGGLGNLTTPERIKRIQYEGPNMATICERESDNNKILLEACEQMTEL